MSDAFENLSIMAADAVHFFLYHSCICADYSVFYLQSTCVIIHQFVIIHHLIFDTFSENFIGMEAFRQGEGLLEVQGVKDVFSYGPWKPTTSP